MRADTFGGEVVAALSRRTLADMPPPSVTHSFWQRLISALSRRDDPPEAGLAAIEPDSGFSYQGGRPPHPS